MSPASRTVPAPHRQDELDEALDRIAAVAALLGLVRSGTEFEMLDAPTVGRAARLIELETLRLRHLLGESS